jgi:thiol-disulfide isomerase/thioredoxin
MHMKITKTFLLALLLLMVGIGQLRAQSLDSLSLLNTDSVKVKLSDFAGKRALVLVFTGNHCVYSKKYEDRLIRIATEFMAKDLAFCLVNSNDPELSQDDRFALMRARAKEKKYPCPYLYDADGTLAKLVGATINPEVFVFKKGDKTWNMLYSGKIDDNPLIEDRVEKQFLTDVLGKIAAGDFSATPSIPAVGCNIKMKE